MTAHRKTKPTFPLLLCTFALSGCFTACISSHNNPEEKTHIIIEDQGSFAAGGTVLTEPGTFDPIRDGAFNPADQNTAGQTLHGDHAFVFYQIPKKSRPFPLVFWHGFGQSMKTWQTTPDGRDGFQNIFLRHRFPVYLVDQPRRGIAGRSTQPTTIRASAEDQLWFGIFRLGLWPDFYPGVQFSKDEAALDQYLRRIHSSKCILRRISNCEIFAKKQRYECHKKTTSLSHLKRNVSYNFQVCGQWNDSAIILRSRKYFYECFSILVEEIQECKWRYWYKFLS